MTANNVSTEEVHLSWAPPLTFTLRTLPSPDLDSKSQTLIPDDPVRTHKKQEPQGDEPVNDALSQDPSPEAINLERQKDFEYSSYNWYKNDKQKYNDDYSSHLLIDDNRSKRDVRSRRHRKRRQDNGTETKLHDEKNLQVLVYPIEQKEVVMKSFAQSKHRDTTKVAYVLYYEQGVPRYDVNIVNGTQTSTDVKRKNVFPSDLGMEDYSRATKNLTLLNTSGKVTKVVGFRLRNLSKWCLRLFSIFV